MKANARARGILRGAEMLAKPRKRRRIGLFTKVAVVVFSIYAAVTLITLQIQINERRREETALALQLETAKARNASLAAAIGSEITDEMIAQQARSKLDLVAPGEKVFIDTSN